MTSLLWISLLVTLGVSNIAPVAGKPHEVHPGYYGHGIPQLVPILQSPARHSPGIRHTGQVPGQPNPMVHQISSGYYNELLIYPEAIGKIVQGVPSVVAGDGTGQQPPPAGTAHQVPMVPYHPMYVIFGHLVPALPQQGVSGTQAGTEAHQETPSSGGAVPGVATSTRGDGMPQVCTYLKETGFCYQQSKCAREKGRVTSYCRDFTKSCCIFNYECGQTTDKEVFHFRNSYWPLPEKLSEPCPLTIRKKDSSVCFFKIQMVKLSLPASLGYCDDVNLQVNGIPGKNYAKLCGEFDSTAEYYLDVESTDEITLKMYTTIPTRLSWNILVIQIPCSASPGTSWPREGGSDTSGGAQDIVPEVPETPKVAVSEEPENPAPDTSVDICGVSNYRSLQIRNRGQVSASPYDSHSFEENPFGLAFVGERRQIPLREEEEEEEKEEGETKEEKEQGGKKVSNRDSTTPQLTWGVPTNEDSILAHYAGQPSTVGTRITYGAKTKQHEYPWAVAMYSGSKFHCGGSLISRKHVLTAAHCVLRYKRRPDRINLSVGDWDINSKADGKNIVSKVSKIVTHPGYSTSTLKYDVAVLTLKEPVPISNTVVPVCLPPKSLDVESKLVTVIGWGRDEKNNLQSVLMQHSANVVTNRECNKRWEATGAPNGIIVNSMLCMDPQDGDSCKGDSGGPSIMEYPEGSSQYVQVGIVSFGSPSCTDKKLPGVYTKVTSVLDWIEEQMN